MNKNLIFKIAKKNTPLIKIIGKEGWKRYDVLSLLTGNKNIGIELGVAQGFYSKKCVESNKFKKFFGVDIYGDIHDTNEYISALKNIGFENQSYSLLRMNFDSALSMFNDNYFDFIYVDGFAHTGEEGGKTLVDWVKKLKVGGIMAGDDYHQDWPLVVWAVNDIAQKLDVEVSITLETENEIYSKYPTWYFKKKNNLSPSLDPLLYKLGMQEKKRINFYRVGAYAKTRRVIVNILDILKIKGFIKNLLSK